MIRGTMLKPIRTLLLAAATGAGLCAAPPGLPAPDEVAAAVRQMGSADFETREAAFERILGWGARHPNEILRMLPAEPGDPEIAGRCQALRDRIAWAAVRLAAIEKGHREPGLPAAVDAFIASPDGRTLNELCSLAVRLGDVEVSEACASVIAEFARREGEPQTRTAALNTLVRLASAEAPKLAAAWLESGDFQLQYAAANALRLRGKREHVPLILDALAGSHDQNLKRILIEALGDLGDPSAIPALAKELETNARHPAARALGKLKAREQVPVFLQMLRHPNFADRIAAITALGFMEDPAHIPVLEKLSENDPEESVRKLAGNAVDQIRKAGAGEK